MKKTHNIFRRLHQWYRRIIIGIPEGYGDPISPKVEEFQREMNDKHGAMDTTPDGKENMEGNKDDHRHKQ